MPFVLHGIPNCDTVKRARAWMAAQGLAPQFHDFKKAGVPEALADWVAEHGWERVLNRKGTAWRALAPERQAVVVDAASAMALMREVPSLIKRPVVQWPDGATTVGFDEATFTARAAALNTA